MAQSGTSRNISLVIANHLAPSIPLMFFHVVSAGSNYYENSIFIFLINRAFIQVPACYAQVSGFCIACEVTLQLSQRQLQHDLPGNAKSTDKGLYNCGME